VSPVAASAGTLPPRECSCSCIGHQLRSGRLGGAGFALYGTRPTGSWRPSLQRLLPFVQSLWLSTKWAAIHVRKKGQLAAVLTTPTFENGPKLGLCWACGRGGRKVVAFDATYIWPGRIGENVRPTLGAVHGRDHDRLQSLGLAAARGVHDGAWRGSGVGHRPVRRGWLRGWLRGGSRRRPGELVASPTGSPAGDAPLTATGIPGCGRTGVSARCARSTTSTSAVNPHGRTARSTIADSPSPVTRCDWS